MIGDGGRQPRSCSPKNTDRTATIRTMLPVQQTDLRQVMRGCLFVTGHGSNQQVAVV